MPANGHDGFPSARPFFLSPCSLLYACLNQSSQELKCIPGLLLLWLLSVLYRLQFPVMMLGLGGGWFVNRFYLIKPASSSALDLPFALCLRWCLSPYSFNYSNSILLLLFNVCLLVYALVQSQAQRVLSLLISGGALDCSSRSSTKKSGCFFFFSFPRLQWDFTIAIGVRVLAVLHLIDYRFFFHRRYRERVCFFHSGCCFLSQACMLSWNSPQSFLGDRDGVYEGNLEKRRNSFTSSMAPQFLMSFLLSLYQSVNYSSLILLTSVHVHLPGKQVLRSLLSSPVFVSHQIPAAWFPETSAF